VYVLSSTLGLRGVGFRRRACRSLLGLVAFGILVANIPLVDPVSGIRRDFPLPIERTFTSFEIESQSLLERAGGSNVWREPKL
jgi:hypothetical protein